MSKTSQKAIIELANNQDFKEIMQLYNQLWEKWDLYDASKIQEIFDADLTSGRKMYLIAKITGKIVGVCSLLIKNDLHYITVGVIDELIVDASNRGQGIGKQLVDKACSLAKDKKCYRVELHSNMVRTDAHKFYQSQGFEKSSYYFKKKL